MTEKKKRPKRTPEQCEKERILYWKKRGYETVPAKKEVMVRSATVDAPVKVKKRAAMTGEADYSRARVTVAPKPQERFSVGAEFVGEFSRAGIGRYVEEA